jgi:hypothetical protein
MFDYNGCSIDVCRFNRYTCAGMEGRITAPACRLDEDGLRAQLERYHQLGGHVEAIDREPGRLVARLDATVDRGALERALEVERACCPFIGVDYDPQARRLMLTVQEAAQHPALDALYEALTSRPAA